VKFTKMNITGQLSTDGSERFAQRIGASYVIAAIGVLLAGFAGLIAVIRWW